MKTQTQSKPLRRSLQRALLEAKKTITESIDNKYENLNAFCDYLTRKPDALTIEKRGEKITLETAVMESSSKSKHVVMFDRELAEKFEEDEIYVDGTFDAVPQIKGVHQLLVLLGTKYNVVSYVFE